MTQSPDHPELPFVQARYYQRGRPGPPKWLIAHTMEAGESSTRAENTAAYFANPGDGRFVSAHYCVDNNSIVCCVRLSDMAYTVGNAQGNGRGINWEFSGFAGQTAAQWGDEFSMDMLRLAAPYWAADARRYGIPIVRRTVAELREGRPGLTTHNDLRLAFGGTTHTDPGPNFPWAQFIEMINGGASGMSEQEVLNALVEIEPYRDHGVRDAAVAAGRASEASLRGLVEIAGGAVLYGLNAAPVKLSATQYDVIVSKLDEILAALAAGGGGGGGGLAPHTHSGGTTGPAVPE